MSQLPSDCLNEIFEYLYEYKDKTTLHSCLLVNRLWCQVSVRILWREDWGCWANGIRDYSILIACLPNESKEILDKNGINIPTPTSKPPIFNYAAFCKVISIQRIEYIVEYLLRKNQQSISLQQLYDNRYIVVQEIFKMFMNQISLRELVINNNYTPNPMGIAFSSCSGAKDCLKNLSELWCCSGDFYPEILNQLSQICSNIQTIYIKIGDHISDLLKDLIISQNNLKHLTLCESGQESHGVVSDIIPSLAKLSHNTLIKLELLDMYDYLPSIAGITNLHELEICFDVDTSVHENAFSELRYVIFPRLQILKIVCGFRFINPGILISFLENNGKNLKELQIDGPKRLNLTIAKACPNLQMLTTCISRYDLNILKKIFNNCQHLESIRALYYNKYLNEYELLKVIIGCSPKKFSKLTLDYDNDVNSKLLPKELESLLISWTNRIPQKSLSLSVCPQRAENSLDKDEENMKIIEKYIKLGAIKKFEVIDLYNNMIKKITIGTTLGLAALDSGV